MGPDKLNTPVCKYVILYKTNQNLKNGKSVSGKYIVPVPALMLYTTFQENIYETLTSKYQEAMLSFIVYRLNVIQQRVTPEHSLG